MLASIEKQDKSGQCFHCKEPIASLSFGVKQETYTVQVNGQSKPVCCAGCKAVAEFILNTQQANYYSYRDSRALKADSDLLGSLEHWKYYDTRPEYWGEKNSDTNYKLYLDIAGMHCSACSWLISNSTLENYAVKNISVDVVTGVASIEWNPEQDKLSKILSHISKLGYKPSLLNESVSDDEQRNQELKRLVVAGLGMMQVMMYAVALYAGEWSGMQPVYQRFLTWVSLLITGPVLFYSGKPFLQNAWTSLKHKSLHMDIPIAIALILAFSFSCINFFRGYGAVYFDSVVMFIFFISAARFIQNRLLQKNMQTQQALSRILPNFVKTDSQQDDSFYKPLELVKAGDRLLVAQGAVVPVDAILLDDRAEFNEALLTGESESVVKKLGQTLSAGTVNVSQAVSVEAITEAQQSTLAILSKRILLSNLNKEVAQTRIANFANIFVLCVLLIALASFFYWTQRDSVAQGIEIALAILVISCPCALSMAIPGGLAALTQALHKQGIHVVNANSLLLFNSIDTVLFDKTGTLTELQFSQDNINVLADNFTSKTVLDIVVALEKASIHPIARCFHHIKSSVIAQEIHEIKGKGITASINSSEYALGSLKFVNEFLKTTVLDISAKTGNIYLASVDELIAVISVQQQLRKGALSALKIMHEEHLCLEIISGDNEESVSQVASQLEIKNFRFNQSSQDKKSHISALQAQKKKVLMVGDGINDAEVLNKSDIGVSFSSASELAQASADILLSGASLHPLSLLFRATKKMHRVIKQNITWAIIYNLLLIPIAFFGYIKPWMAALSMSFSSLFVVLNSSRLRSAVKETAEQLFTEKVSD